MSEGGIEQSFFARLLAFSREHSEKKPPRIAHAVAFNYPKNELQQRHNHQRHDVDNLD